MYDFLSSYEQLATTSSPNMAISVDTPVSKYPHESHDISILSHYLLEVTAFAPGDMRSALRMRDTMNSKTVDEYYTDISANFKATKTLDFGKIKHVIRDPDRVGIILEHEYMYYTVMVSDDGRDQECGWLKANQIDMHLLCEWASLPKRIIGTDFIAAATFPDGGGGGWWHVHGEMITFLRATLEEEAEYMIWSGGAKFAGRPEKDVMGSICGTLFRRQMLQDHAKTSMDWREMESVTKEFPMWVEISEGVMKGFTVWEEMENAMKEYIVWDEE